MPHAIDQFAGDLCDFVFVDGGHYGTVPYWDIVHFAHLSRKQALLVIDDMHMDDVHLGTSMANSQDYIGEVTCAEALGLINPDGSSTLCATSFSKHGAELLAGLNFSELETNAAELFELGFQTL